ncbi:hypothetical protein DFH11DRAFT_1132613 [Phellopilus nigrolimitatus]|nr:hypothetical protein DFH11DRAFT_1132613 [Phellopilus nigrolimitatus]
MARGKDKDYEVERILKAVVSYKHGRKIQWKYYVKWKGYNDKDNTWEPSESFDQSPALIRNFWKKVDTEGREVTSARSFKRGEELFPRDGEQPNGSDAEVDQDAEGEPEHEEPYASAKGRGRKRTSTIIATSETPTKRKRGRSSRAGAEAAKKSADDEVAEESDTRRRSTRRLSEKTYSVKGKRFSKGIGKEKQDSDENSESEEKPKLPKKTARQKANNTPPRKKRKAYIEESEEGSEEESDAEPRDAERASSHGGSLFSGDEGASESEQENIGASEPAAVTLGSTTAPERQPEEKPVREPTANIPSPSTIERQRQLGKKPAAALPYHRARAARPLVKMIDDPNIDKAVEARVRARQQGALASGSGSNAKEPSASGSLTQVINDGETRKPIATYRPTLLTFERGKLTPQRREAALSVSPNEMTPVAQEHPEDLSAMEVDTLDSVPMDTIPDHGLLTSTVDDVEAPSDTAPREGPPPAADELLRLSGSSIGRDDLPEFNIDEDTVVSATTNDPATSSFGQASGALATPGAASWKQSTIFGPATPLTALSKAFATVTTEPPRPTQIKTVMPLRLDPASTIPMVFKDVSPSTYGSSQKLTTLLMGELDGPPGKLFPEAVLEHVTLGGSSARLGVDVSASDEQRLWFSKLMEELEKRRLFIVTVGGQSLVLCSSQNRDAAKLLGLPSSLVGLSKNIVVQQIIISNYTSYANIAVEAEEIKLSQF